MIVHNLNPVAIDFGIFQITWYSLAYIIGIILGLIYAKKIIKKIKREHSFLSFDINAFDNSVIYLVLGIILGGRIGYVFFYNLEYYLVNLKEILMIWKGGMSFHGGLIGLIMASLIFTKKNNLDFLKFTDILSCVAPIGIFFGRIANFINGELYGKVSSVPWAVYFPNGGDMPRHPSQIYEAILEGIILFIIINFFSLKKNQILFKGVASSMFLIFYSCFRILAEYYREADAHLGYFLNVFSMGTLLSTIMLVAGLALFVWTKK